MGVGLEVLVLLVLILANGVFAMSELALVSAREVRLRRQAEEGDGGAQAALELVAEPSRFLSTVQIGISLIAVFLGALGTATLADDLAVLLGAIPFLAPYADAVAFALVVLVITYVSLVLGELVPKRLALSNPERFSSLVARPMSLIATLAGPAVRLLSFSTETVVRLLRVDSSSEPDVTEEEIRRLIEQATSAGVFDPVEQELVEKIFRVGDRRVDSLMTPRPQISWLDVNEPTAESWAAMSESGHSEFPLCDGTLDEVLGLVSIKQLWLQAMDGRKPDPREAMRPAPLVPENMPALKVLEVFRESGSHVVVVIDEYGGTQGLVTPVDVLEAIAGDLPSPDEPPEPRAIKRDDGSWLFDGALSADALRETFGLRSLPEEERGDYQTVGGFVMMHMRRIPEEGERFEWGGLGFEVVDMDGNRVDKVLITPTPDETGETAGETESP